MKNRVEFYRGNAYLVTLTLVAQREDEQAHVHLCLKQTASLIHWHRMDRLTLVCGKMLMEEVASWCLKETGHSELCITNQTHQSRDEGDRRVIDRSESSESCPGGAAWAIPFHGYLQNTYCLLRLVQHSLDIRVAIGKIQISILCPHTHTRVSIQKSRNPSPNEGQASKWKKDEIWMEAGPCWDFALNLENKGLTLQKEIVIWTFWFIINQRCLDSCLVLLVPVKP